MSSTQTEKNSASIRQQLSGSSSLLGALDAASNWRALMVLGGTYLGVFILSLFLGFITLRLSVHSNVFGTLVGFAAAIIVFLLYLVGFNTTGIILADDTWERAPRSLTDALFASAFATFRLLAVGLIGLAVFLLFLLVILILLFLCKIPGLGPILYAFVLPIGTIACGLLIFAFTHIAFPLAAPAAWSAVSLKRILVTLKEVVRTRFFHTIVMIVLLELLTLFIFSLIWLILGSGTGIMAIFSALVINVQTNMGGMGGMGGMGNLFGMMNSGYGYAGVFSTVILFLTGLIPATLILMKGLVIIHREVTANLSLDAAEAEIDRQMEDLKQRAEEARQRAVAAGKSQEVPDSKPDDGSDNTGTPPLSCPDCHASVHQDDLFCGNCGCKLK